MQRELRRKEHTVGWGHDALVCYEGLKASVKTRSLVRGTRSSAEWHPLHVTGLPPPPRTGAGVAMAGDCLVVYGGLRPPPSKESPQQQQQRHRRRGYVAKRGGGAAAAAPTASVSSSFLLSDLFLANLSKGEGCRVWLKIDPPGAPVALGCPVLLPWTDGGLLVLGGVREGDGGGGDGEDDGEEDGEEDEEEEEEAVTATAHYPTPNRSTYYIPFDGGRWTEVSSLPPLPLVEAPPTQASLSQNVRGTLRVYCGAAGSVGGGGGGDGGGGRGGDPQTMHRLMSIDVGPHLRAEGMPLPHPPHPRRGRQRNHPRRAAKHHAATATATATATPAAATEWTVAEFPPPPAAAPFLCVGASCYLTLFSVGFNAVYSLTLSAAATSNATDTQGASPPPLRGWTLLHTLEVPCFTLHKNYSALVQTHVHGGGGGGGASVAASAAGSTCCPTPSAAPTPTLLLSADGRGTGGSACGHVPALPCIASLFCAVEVDALRVAVFPCFSRQAALPQHVFLFNVGKPSCCFLPCRQKDGSEAAATASVAASAAAPSPTASSAKHFPTPPHAPSPQPQPPPPQQQQSRAGAVAHRLPALKKQVMDEALRTIVACKGSAAGAAGYSSGGRRPMSPAAESRAELQRAVERIKDGVLDLRACEATEELVYIVTQCVNHGLYGVERVVLADAAEVSAESARLLLSMLRSNRSILALACGPRCFAAARTVEHRVAAQLRANVAHHDAAGTQRRRREHRSARRRELREERRRREWAWRLQADRLRLEAQRGVEAFACGERCGRALLALGWEEGVAALGIRRAGDAEAVRAALRRREALRREQAAFVASEEPARRAAERAEEEARVNLQMQRVASKRAHEALQKNRVRQERALRDEAAVEEKAARQALKEEEGRCHRTLAAEHRTQAQRLAAEWRRVQAEAREAEALVREEAARKRREEEQRLQRQARAAEQRKREQKAALLDENSARYVLGNTEQDGRVVLQKLFQESEAIHLLLQEEGAARREAAALNFCPPTLRAEELPMHPYCQASPSTTAPTPCCADVSLAVEAPCPAHLRRGASFPFDKETAEEWVARKTTPLEGRIVTYLSSAYYHPTACVTLFGDIEESDTQLVLDPADQSIHVGQKGARRRLGRVLANLTPRDVWMLEGHGLDDCPSNMLHDDSSYGLAVMLEGGCKLPDYDAVLQHIGVTCEKQTPMQEKLQLVISVDVEFVAPEVRNMRVPLRKDSGGTSPTAPPKRGASGSVSMLSMSQRQDTSDACALVAYTDKVFGDDVYEEAGSVDKELPTSLTGGHVVSHLKTTLHLHVLMGSFVLPAGAERCTFVEGDTALRLFKGVDVHDMPSQVVVRLINKQAEDEINLRSPATLKANSRIVRIEGKEVGTVQKRDRSDLVFTPHESVSLYGMSIFLECITFENASEDPDPAPRTVHMRFVHNGGVDTCCNVAIDVVPEDDPTVIMWGVARMPFRRRSGYLIDPLQKIDDAHPWQEYLHFSAAATITDVDTEEFKEGLLVVQTQTYSRGDNLYLVPPKGSPITRSGRTLFHKGVQLGTLGPVADHPEGFKVVFGEGDTAAVTKLNHLIKCIVFSTQSGREGLRTVEATLWVDEYPAVRASCQLRVTGPLLVVQPENQTVVYRERCGDVPLGPFELPELDDGWDGGFIHAVISEGATLDDSVRIAASPDLQDAEYEARAALRPDTPLSGSSQSAAGAASTSAGGLGKLKEKIKLHMLVGKGRTAGVAARVSDMKQALIEELRKRGAPRAEVRELRDKSGRVLATYSNAPHGVLIHMTTCAAIVNTEAERSDSGRLELAHIKKQDAAMILGHLAYCNTAENLKATRKVISVTINDGLPHSSRAFIEVNLQPADATTHLRKKGREPLHYRQGQSGGTFLPLFRDCVLHNARKQTSYSGGYLVTEPVSGGDSVGDQLGFLSLSDQEYYYEQDRKDLLAAQARRETALTSATVASLKVVVGAGGAGGGSAAVAPGTTGGGGGASSDKPEKKLGATGAKLMRRAKQAPAASSTTAPAVSASAAASPPPVTGAAGLTNPAATEAQAAAAAAMKSPSDCLSERRKAMALNPADRVYIQLGKDGVLSSVSLESGEALRQLGVFTSDEATSACRIDFEAAGEPVGSDLAEVCMWSIAYSNASSKLKAGTIIYQLRAVPQSASCDARCKVSLKVSPPYLWAPEYAKSMTFKEGDAWMPVNTKVTANLPVNGEGRLEVCVKAPVTAQSASPAPRRASFRVAPGSFSEQPADNVRWDFTLDPSFCIRGDQLFCGKDLVASVVREPKPEAPARRLSKMPQPLSPKEEGKDGGRPASPSNAAAAAASNTAQQLQPVAAAAAAAPPASAFQRSRWHKGAAFEVVANSAVLRLEWRQPGMAMTSKALTALLRCVCFRSDAIADRPVVVVEMLYHDTRSGSSIAVPTTIYKKRRGESASHVDLNLKRQPVAYTLGTSALPLCPAATLVPVGKDASPSTTGVDAKLAHCKLLGVSVVSPLEGDELTLGGSVSVTDGDIFVRGVQAPVGTVARVVGAELSAFEVALPDGAAQKHVEAVLRGVCYNNSTQRQRNTRRCVSVRVDSGETKVVQLELLPSMLDLSQNTSTRLPTRKRDRAQPVCLLHSPRLNLKDTPDVVVTFTSATPLTFALLPTLGLHLEVRSTACERSTRSRASNDDAARSFRSPRSARSASRRSADTTADAACAADAANDAAADAAAAAASGDVATTSHDVVADGKIVVAEWRLHTAVRPANAELSLTPPQPALAPDVDDTESQASSVRSAGGGDQPGPQTLVIQLPSSASKVRHPLPSSVLLSPSLQHVCNPSHNRSWLRERIF